MQILESQGEKKNLCENCGCMKTHCTHPNLAPDNVRQVKTTLMHEKQKAEEEGIF